MVAQNPVSQADREIVIERTFAAPARLLFLAYSKPEHMKRWWGPQGFPLTLCEMDFRPGGAFRFAMSGPSGVQMPAFGGVFAEIVENQRIVSVLDVPGEGEMRWTTTFEERADGATLLRLVTLFATVEMKQAHTARGYALGVNSGLDTLVDYVKELK